MSKRELELIEAQNRKRLTQLMKLPFITETLNEFMPKCTELCKDLVANPESFCGAFWKEKEQWYHGPVKTDLSPLEQKLNEIKEQIGNIELTKDLAFLLDGIKMQQELIITLLNKKIDLDVKEEKLIDVLMSKFKKG